MTTTDAAGLDLGARKWIHVIDSDVAKQPGESRGAKLLRERRKANCAALDAMRRKAPGDQRKIGTGGNQATIARFPKCAEDYETSQLTSVGLFALDLPLDWSAGSIPLGGFIALADVDEGLFVYPEPDPYPLYVGSTAGHGIVLVNEPRQLEQAVRRVIGASVKGPYDPDTVFADTPRPFRGEIRGDDRIDGEIVIQPVAALSWQGSAEIRQGVRLTKRLKNSLAAMYEAPSETWALAANLTAGYLWEDDDLEAVREEIENHRTRAIQREKKAIGDDDARPADLRGRIAGGHKTGGKPTLGKRIMGWLKG